MTVPEKRGMSLGSGGGIVALENSRGEFVGRSTGQESEQL